MGDRIEEEGRMDEEGSKHWEEPSIEDVEAAKPLALAIELLRESFKARFGVYPNEITIDLSGGEEI